MDGAYTSSFCPFSGRKMFMPVYRVFDVPSAGRIAAKVAEVPSNGIIMIWLQEVDDPSTKVISPNILGDQGLLIDQPTGKPATLSADVSKPALWGIMIQCIAVGELQDSDYSFS